MGKVRMVQKFICTKECAVKAMGMPVIKFETGDVYFSTAGKPGKYFKRASVSKNDKRLTKGMSAYMKIDKRDYPG